MRIHLIAIGGAAMHNVALALHHNGHHVTGSDDEIYNPAADRLRKYGLLPEKTGWYTENITLDLDCVILGMHAKKDNPELLHAQSLGLKIYSYPEFVYQHAKDKKRVVVAGSHGKTSTTSMVMHVLKTNNVDFDYLVGALLEGFETMVRFSDAPVMVIEGDEYLASPIDLQPKIMHYRPHLAVITGVAWDHINVFPTFESYISQFDKFAKTIEPEGTLFYFQHDKELTAIAQTITQATTLPYQAFEYRNENGITFIALNGKEIQLEIFGEHNLSNLRAAYEVCRELGITDEQFATAAQTFKGAAKRLQPLYSTVTASAFLDFAHAPSKVKATVSAVKQQFPNRRLVACLELHTFSSLNQAFLQEYAHSLDAADLALIYFSDHALKMKKMPPLEKMEVQSAFQHPKSHVFNETTAFQAFLAQENFTDTVLLFMSSGTFDGLEYVSYSQDLLG